MERMNEQKNAGGSVKRTNDCFDRDKMADGLMTAPMSSAG
jgi:hypothetical protein